MLICGPLRESTFYNDLECSEVEVGVVDDKIPRSSSYADCRYNSNSYDHPLWWIRAMSSCTIGWTESDPSRANGTYNPHQLCSSRVEQVCCISPAVSTCTHSRPPLLSLNAEGEPLPPFAGVGALHDGCGSIDVDVYRVDDDGLGIVPAEQDNQQETLSCPPASKRAVPLLTTSRLRIPPAVFWDAVYGQGTMVTLHVYETWLSSLVCIPNARIFHLAMEVYGKEFFFGRKGIQVCSPGKNPQFDYREAVLLGRTSLRPKDLAAVVEHLHMKWPTGSYHPLWYNCQHFVCTFGVLLGLAPDCVPPWYLLEVSKAFAIACSTSEKDLQGAAEGLFVIRQKGRLPKFLSLEGNIIQPGD